MLLHIFEIMAYIYDMYLYFFLFLMALNELMLDTNDDIWLLIFHHMLNILILVFDFHDAKFDTMYTILIWLCCIARRFSRDPLFG